MNRINLLLCVIAFFCSSCQHDPNDVIELQGKRVEMDDAYLGSSPILLDGNLLISQSNAATSNCVISLLENGSIKISQSLFTVGNGNNEFHNTAIAKGLDSKLYVLDYPNTGNQLFSVTQITNTNSISSIKDKKAWKKYPLINLPSFRCVFNTFVLLSDSTILVPGSTYSEIGHILSVINYKRQTVTPLNYWPEDGVKGDSLAKHSIYTDNCRIYGNDNKEFLYTCGEERFAFIFTIEGNNIKVKKELYSVYPDYKCMEDGNYMINARSGNSLITEVNNENIYAFLIKDTLKNNYVSRSGNMIEVYDWNGKLEKTIKLDKVGDIIKVSEDNDILYLFTNSPESGETEIWMYDIKDI